MLPTSTIEAVLFDFDGTITTPGHLDFDAIRSAIGCPTGVSILTYIEELDPAKRAHAEAILDRFEIDAAGTVSAAPGLGEVIGFLRSRSIGLGILTRNTLRAINRSFENISCCDARWFSCIITRDDDLPVKPEPHGVLEAANRLLVKPHRMLVVGDYLYDIEAGKRAGAPTVFLDVIPNRNFAAPDSDFVIADLRSMVTMLATYWR